MDIFLFDLVTFLFDLVTFLFELVTIKSALFLIISVISNISEGRKGSRNLNECEP